ncbi:uncharacterized protein YbjT (DUF2867 family) [Allocatelliglobosispora scoriae]|uniref:Uncharacterized protein YbjT (DUF2867 family) n=1 Tax=Allocatelliglobosispora scoriae TaxID=643052 RepID=A0A841BDX1_9ACTN|nr:NmrA family NAD(P)-binding protein [Allocatelliglobosispora scoriae]MBB5867297.1 uncharacterized protein YbjT (DUF2867 family) [Allocatelliglobosispora scoriae]
MTTLVIGATGKQGGATARALLDAGWPVRALVRDVGVPPARELAARGAELVRGDLDDPASLVAAATGVSSVFSIPFPDLADLASDAELRRGRNLVTAAREAGVPQFVHTSVSGAGDFSAPGWAEGRWDRHYWDSKAGIDELVRTSGFAHWTVLKPATFMENLLGWSYLFGDWTAGGFVTGFAADTVLAWIAVQDIGDAAAAAIADPARFGGHDIELAGDLLTMTETAAIVSEVLGRTVPAPVLTIDEAIERGLPAFMGQAVDRINVVGSPARPEHAHAFGLHTTDFRTWAREHLR